VLLLLIELNAAAVVLAGVMVLTYSLHDGEDGGWMGRVAGEPQVARRAISLLLAVFSGIAGDVSGCGKLSVRYVTLSASGHRVEERWPLISVPLNGRLGTLGRGDDVDSGLRFRDGNGRDVFRIVNSEVATGTVLLAGRGWHVAGWRYGPHRRVTFFAVAFVVLRR